MREASRSTSDQILTELDERGWAERTADGAYAVTPVVEFAVVEFAHLVGAMQAIRTLDDTVDWLPREKLSIGLHHFREATVNRPEPNGPMAPDSEIPGGVEGDGSGWRGGGGVPTGFLDYPSPLDRQGRIPEPPEHILAGDDADEDTILHHRQAVDVPPFVGEQVD